CPDSFDIGGLLVGGVGELGLGPGADGCAPGGASLKVNISVSVSCMCISGERVTTLRRASTRWGRRLPALGLLAGAGAALTPPLGSSQTFNSSALRYCSCSRSWKLASPWSVRTSTLPSFVEMRMSFHAAFIDRFLVALSNIPIRPGPAAVICWP